MAGTEKTASVMPGGGGAGGSAPPPAPWTGPSWAAGLHHKLHDFVKKGLLKQLMFPGATVCDLFCGRGPDTAKWAEAGTGHYIGVDLSASALEEAREEWIGRGKPYPAFFCELDPCMKNLHACLEGHGLPADVVCCLGHLQDCFSNEETLKSLLNNVTTLLKPGGMFFGITPDSSTIWYKYQKAVEGAMKTGSLRANGALPRVKNELFTISFENDRFNFYGTKYQLRFADDGLPPQAQLLVHFPSLIRTAEEVGLECVEIQNLFDFYEDFRTTFAEALRGSCGTVLDPKGRLPNQAHEVLSLYSTFIFKKVEVPAIQLCRLSAVSKRPASDNSKNHVFGMCGVVSSTEHLESPPKKQRLDKTAGRSKKLDANTVASNRLELCEGEMKRQRTDLPDGNRRQQVEEDHKATRVVSSAEHLESPPKKQRLDTTAGRSKKPDADTVASNRLEPCEGEMKRQITDLPGDKRRQQVEEAHKATKCRSRKSLEPMASWAEQNEMNNAAGLGKVTESSELHSEKSGVHKEVVKYERSPDRGEMCRRHLGTTSRNPVSESRLQAEGTAQKVEECRPRPKRQKLDIAAGHEHHLPEHQVKIMTLVSEGVTAEVRPQVDESKNPILKLSTIDVYSGPEQHVLTVQSAGGTPSAAQSETLKVIEQKSAGYKEQCKLAQDPTQGSGLERENNVGCRAETRKTRLKPEQKQDSDAMTKDREEGSLMPRVDNDKRKANRVSRKRWEPVASSASDTVADCAPEKTAQGPSPQCISEASVGRAPSTAQTTEAVVGGVESGAGAGEAVAGAGVAAAVAWTSEAPAAKGTAEAPEPTDDVDKVRIAVGEASRPVTSSVKPGQEPVKAEAGAFHKQGPTGKVIVLTKRAQRSSDGDLIASEPAGLSSSLSDATRSQSRGASQNRGSSRNRGDSQNRGGSQHRGSSKNRGSSQNRGGGKSGNHEDGYRKQGRSSKRKGQRQQQQQLGLEGSIHVEDQFCHQGHIGTAGHNEVPEAEMFLRPQVAPPYGYSKGEAHAAAVAVANAAVRNSLPPDPGYAFFTPSIYSVHPSMGLQELQLAAGHPASRVISPSSGILGPGPGPPAFARLHTPRTNREQGIADQQTWPSHTLPHDRRLAGVRAVSRFHRDEWCGPQDSFTSRAASRALTAVPKFDSRNSSLLGSVDGYAIPSHSNVVAMEAFRSQGPADKWVEANSEVPSTL